MVNDIRIERKNIIKARYQAIVKNPYFGFIILAIALVILQVLQMLGIGKVSMVNAIGGAMIYSIVGLGFSILLGYAGLASLGTAGFIGLGAYITGYFLKEVGIPYTFIFIITVLVSIIIGILVGFISLRIEGIYLGIITLALSELLVSLFKNLEITGQTSGMTIGAKLVLFKFTALGFEGIKIPMQYVYFIIVGVLLVLIFVTYNIIKSPIGRAMLAMKNSDSAAKAMGVNVLKYRILAFVIATAYAFIGGFLYMGYYRNSNPYTWSLALSLNILAAVIVGGGKSIWGVMSGTVVIFSLKTLVLDNIPLFVKYPDLSLLVNGILIIVIIMFYPGGLARLAIDVKSKVKKLNRKMREKKYGPGI